MALSVLLTTKLVYILSGTGRPSFLLRESENKGQAPPDRVYFTYVYPPEGAYSVSVGGIETGMVIDDVDHSS